MKDLVAEIRSRYDDRMIILNAPPIHACADATILAEQSDYVVLSVPYGRVTKAEIADAVRAIGPAKIAGVVFCDEPRVPSFRAGELFREAMRQIRRPIDLLRRIIGGGPAGDVPVGARQGSTSSAK
jgi:Mrp family chromosome partitioning ATPase